MSTADVDDDAPAQSLKLSSRFAEAAAFAEAADRVKPNTGTPAAMKKRKTSSNGHEATAGYAPSPADETPERVIPPWKNSYGQIFTIAPITKPIGQFGNVVLNATAATGIGEAREHARVDNIKRFNVPPLYPIGKHESTYDIQTRELVFVTRARYHGDDRKSAPMPPGSMGQQTWTSFNGMPHNHCPVFIGVADTAVKLARGPSQSMTNKHSVAIQGTRTVLAGPDQVHLGDKVKWCMPYVVTREGSKEAEPGLRVTGAAPDKMVAHVGPLSFSNHRGPNLLTALAATLNGSFRATEDNGSASCWAKVKSVIKLMLSHKRDGNPTDDEFKTLADLASHPLFPRSKAWAIDQHTSMANGPVAADMLSGRAGKGKMSASDVFIQQCLLAMAYWMNEHTVTHLEMAVGTAMSTAVAGGVDVAIGRR